MKKILFFPADPDFQKNPMKDSWYDEAGRVDIQKTGENLEIQVKI